MQRTELSRLRNLLAKSLAAVPTQPLPKSPTNRLRGRLLLSVGMDNAVRYVIIHSFIHSLNLFL